MGRERDINRYMNELDASRNMIQRTTDEKLASNGENERLKNHIMVLTDQNQKLVLEIENIMEQDERVRQQLCRKDRSMALLRNNKVNVEKSLNNIDDYLNRSSNGDYKSFARSPN